MRSRYEVILNGQAMSALSSDILIRDIRYTTPQIRNDAFTTARRQGKRMYWRYIEKSTVTISFEIHAYNTMERQEVCNAVNAWAKNGGILQTNDRNGQRLRCICEAFPVVTSVLKWTDPLSITFAAYMLPFWEDEIPATLTLPRGKTGSGDLYVPGNVDGAMVEVDIKANAALASVSLTVNNKTLSLTGLSVASGDTIKIAYDDDLIQSIKVGTITILNRRTGADDLLANCGEVNHCSYTSNASVNVEFRARGLWI